MMAQHTLFHDVPQGPIDPMFVLKQASDSDQSVDKIDIGIGVYRGDSPGYYEFKAVAAAKRILSGQPANHEYNPTTGIGSFVQKARELAFGEKHRSLTSNSIASVQTVGGTGAVRLGAAFLNRNFPSHSSTARLPNPTKIFVGAPGWPNYKPLFEHAGFEVVTFQHYNPTTRSIDMTSVLKAITEAAEYSIFVLQVCCHNPTGQDYDREQWRQLADQIQLKHHFVFFDMAYQGFAKDMEADAWPIRYFADRGIDNLVCQSFSKHMGLYSERIGVLHVVCKSSSVAANVQDQLRSVLRWEVSSTPAYGARIADTIMRDDQLCKLWLQEVQQACDRMISIRRKLHHLLTSRHSVTGSWDHILAENGLFSYMNLSPVQISELAKKHHTYLAQSGRINIAGLNDRNVEIFALALRDVIDGQSIEQNISTASAYKSQVSMSSSRQSRL